MLPKSNSRCQSSATFQANHPDLQYVCVLVACLLTLFVLVLLEMIPIHRGTLDEKWDTFENAATYSYARSVLKENKNKEQFNSIDDKPRRIMTTIGYV